MVFKSSGLQAERYLCENVETVDMRKSTVVKEIVRDALVVAYLLGWMLFIMGLLLSNVKALVLGLCVAGFIVVYALWE